MNCRRIEGSTSAGMTDSKLDSVQLLDPLYIEKLSLSLSLPLLRQ